MLGNFLDYSSALGGDEKMELGSFTIYGTSNSGLSGPAGYTSDVLQLRDPSDNLLLQFGFKGEIIGIDSSSSMGFMIVRDTGAPDIRMTMGTLTDYLNLVGKSANTGPRIDIGPATTNGRLNIFAALETSNLVFELPNPSGSLPNVSYKYKEAMLYQGGETRFGKWRQYFNAYEMGWGLVYNTEWKYPSNGFGAPGVWPTAVTYATNASPIVITSANHGLITGNKVQISGVNGNTKANGYWTVTVIDSNSFQLNDSSGNAAWQSSPNAFSQKQGRDVEEIAAWVRMNVGEGDTGKNTWEIVFAKYDVVTSSPDFNDGGSYYFYDGRTSGKPRDEEHPLEKGGPHPALLKIRGAASMDSIVQFNPHQTVAPMPIRLQADGLHSRFYIRKWSEGNTINGITNGDPISVNVNNHGLNTGDVIEIIGESSILGANGTWTITVVDANNFTLNNSNYQDGSFSGNATFGKVVYNFIAADASTGYVGIGKANPAVQLDLYTSSGDDQVRTASGSADIRMGANSAGSTYIKTYSNTPMIFYTNDAERLRIDSSGNIGFRTTDQYGAGIGVLGIANAGTDPTTNPSGGGVLYASGGAGKWRGSSGTVTTFGPAEPHCPCCGRDFMLEWQNERYGHLRLCMWCLTEGFTRGICRRDSGRES